MRSCLQRQRLLHTISVPSAGARPRPLSRSSSQAAPPRHLRQHHSTHRNHLAARRAMDVSTTALPAAYTVAIAGVGLGVLAAWLDARRKSRKPELVYTPTEFNSAVLAECPTLHATYEATPCLTNGHVETILVAKLRKPPGVQYRREILLTSDRAAVTIDWEHHDDEGKDLPAHAPVLILFPGLTGGSGDSYVQHAVLQARHAGVRAAVFNSRGTADSPVLTPQFYSASFTGDTREVIAHVRRSYPSSTLYAAGWSLGANILVNYLGEQGADTPLEAAVSMCNPFDLTISNRHINEGFNLLYNYNLASSLKRIFMKHQPLWRGYEGPAQPGAVPGVKTIREFDEAITVHSFDWEDVDAYYAGSSSARRIPDVSVPLLCIQAADDPIAPEEAIPYDAIRANPHCALAVTPCGGHLGWAAGKGAPFGEPWTDGAVFEWLTAVHARLQAQKAQAAAAPAQQQAAVASTRSSSSSGGRDDDEGSNGGSSNGGGGGSYSRQAPGVAEPTAVPVAVAAGGRVASNGSSVAFSDAAVAAAASSSSSSSESSGSSVFVSPPDSPVSVVSSGSSSSVSPSAAAAPAAGTAQQQQPEQSAVRASPSASSLDQLTAQVETQLHALRWAF